METVYKHMGAIVGFSVITLLIQNFLSDEFAEKMVLITLLGVVLINSNKIVEFANNFTLKGE